MRRLSQVLLTAAITGWVAAGFAHVRGVRADGDDGRSAWTTRRDQCLLLSSISMNTLVVVTIYRYGKRLRSGSD